MGLVGGVLATAPLHDFVLGEFDDDRGELRALVRAVAIWLIG
jgi:hypothetical protein